MSWAVPSTAQDTTTFLTPEVGQEAAEYRTLSESRRIDVTTRYVDETDQDWFGEAPKVAPAPRALPSFNGNGVGVGITVAVIVLLLFLFLKFGGAGNLLASDPAAVKRDRKKTKAWGLTAEDAHSQDILSKIRSMKDRRAALILLLRHCLLQAAHETDTTFRRSDTEREALKRLPQGWRQFSNLGILLRRSELVHYGGRPISESDYEETLNVGANILRGAA